MMKIYSDKLWLLPLKVYDHIECTELKVEGYKKLWLTGKAFKATKATLRGPAMSDINL
jgi:hypothetical protein